MISSSWVVVLVVILILIWLAGLSFWLYQIAAHYSRLVGTSNKEDLKQILEDLLKRQDKTHNDIKGINQILSEASNKSKDYFQKIGVVRFNPFGDTGGNQSFAISFLNGTDTGIVILSLHNREGTRIYVKTVKNGKSSHDLSKEELEAIRLAKNNT